MCYSCIHDNKAKPFILGTCCLQLHSFNSLTFRASTTKTIGAIRLKFKLKLVQKELDRIRPGIPYAITATPVYLLKFSYSFY